MSKVAIGIITALVAINLWFGAAIVRLENQRYALSLDMCSGSTPEKLLRQHDCLANVQTRTSPIWHLLYGLRLL
jgi:hypothetical protein